MKILIRFLMLCCCLSSVAMAAPFSAQASYRVCFTPGQDCTAEIVNALDNAKHSILVQAYSFTSAPIAHALVVGKRRGVDVKVILDKSQFRAERYSSSKFLDNEGIPVWIDARPAIAHNKVMIIDHAEVVTGSFNFTKAAALRNAENLLIIHDPILAQQYLDNWNKRQLESFPLGNYHPRRKHKHRGRPRPHW